MADGASIGPEVNLASPDTGRNLASQGDALRGKEVFKANEGITLYKSEKFEVFVPKKPNIPLNEGLHVQVSSGQDQLDSLKEELARYLMGLGSAKVLAESGITQDAWANTRLEEDQVVSAYGRVPGGEKSWRKPVDTFNRNAAGVSQLDPNYNTAKLQELFGRYLSKWEQLTGSMELFTSGVNGKDIAEPSSKEEVPIWENDRFTLVVVTKPHLKGIHLVVHPRESVKRQWQTVIGQNAEQIYIRQTLEATAIAMGVQKILAEGRGEIHNSGNWAGDLKSIEEGGKLNMQKLEENRKMEKRLHRPDLASPENQIRTGMHVHIYIPENGPVILPEMSKNEAIERGRLDVVKQWEEIPATTPAEMEAIKTKLNEGKLTRWLEENCQGKLINNTTPKI